MKEIENLIEALKINCKDTYWFGATSDTAINRMQEILKITLPADFVAFLRICGGGGAESSEICGICDDDADLEVGGTVLYATTYCRNEFDLPLNLAVIYLEDDEICWAIDCDTCQVVSYSLIFKKIDRILNNSFAEFFAEYVELYRDDQQE